jgi:hypothetical protein
LNSNRSFAANVTTQNLWFLRRNVQRFWSAVIFWVQRRHNCSPAASFANCFMTLHLLKSASANVSLYTNN